MTRKKRAHGHATRRYRRPSPTYISWLNMKDRCLNAANYQYHRYGGRGISVCSSWLDFPNFLRDMGERPDDATLDRINSDGNYEPGNCRWATRSEQERNKKTTRLNTEAVKVIRYLCAKGFNKALLGRLHKVSPPLIAQIVRGVWWRAA